MSVRSSKLGLVSEGIEFCDKALYLNESISEIDSSPDILRHLTESERSQVMARGSRKQYAANSFIFHQGDHHDGIFVIESGRVRSFYVSPAGKEITLAYWTARHFVGAPDIYSEGQYMWSSATTEPSCLIWFSGSTIHTLVRQIPNFSLGIIDGLVYKSKCYVALLQLMGTRSMITRLAHLLCTLVDAQDGGLTGSHHKIKRLTHDQIAKMVGTTRQWVSATLRRFETDGLIICKDETFEILDLDGLKNIAAM